MSNIIQNGSRPLSSLELEAVSGGFIGETVSNEGASNQCLQITPGRTSETTCERATIGESVRNQ